MPVSPARPEPRFSLGVVARAVRRRALRLRGLRGIPLIALEQGWAMTRAELGLLRLLDDTLAARTDPRVVVISGSRPNPWAALLRTARPDGTVLLVRPAAEPSRRHVRLAAAGPFDLVLDDVRRAKGRDRLFASTFPHLRRGGLYVDVAGAGRRSGRPEAAVGSLARVVERMQAIVRAPATKSQSRPAQDRAAFARSLSQVRTVSGHLVVANGVDAKAKLYEHEANEVLRLRAGEDRVVSSVDAAELHSRGTFESSTGRRHARMPDIYRAPALSLREYHDVVCAPGQVVVKDNLLLPDTYRHNQRPTLRNNHTIDLGSRFATVAADLDAVEPLAGAWFHLDNEVRGHFGHTITEVVSRLWAVDEARRLAPDLRVLLAINKGRRIQPFERDMFAAFGFSSDDLLLVEQPVRVERLLSATPMFSMPEYVHPAIEDTWTRLGDHLASSATTGATPDRIFLSRRIRKRACLNTPEVEELFAAHGFEVVYPEDHPLGDQVLMFRQASVLAGFAGSGMFNACFAPGPKKMILLEHEAYSATNEYMMASVLGHDVVAVVSEALPATADGKGTRFQSDFVFDFGREGRYLEQVLRDL